MSPSMPDLRLYHSNSLEVLAGLLADVLAEPVPEQPLLRPEIIVIPQPAMRRWLQASLAERCGIAANLEFLTPGEWVARTLQANLVESADDFTADTLHWRVYTALTDPDCLAHPGMRQITAHLCGNNKVPDPLAAWGLAGELAQVFEKYQAWRRDWLLDWERGAAQDDPQAILWRRIAGGQAHRARRIHEYLEQFEHDDGPLPHGMPRRLFAFATQSVSPDVLRILASQARVGTLHFYLFSPSQVYWGDLRSRFERHGDNAHVSGENRLLQALGTAGRDFMALIGSYEWIHPRGEVNAWVDPETNPQPSMHNGGLGDSLLHRLQSDLFHRRPPPAHTRLPDIRLHDPSLQIHACHTRIRELQVLHDQLHALLDDSRFDPPLQPREIAVLAPDITPYAPYLLSVFGDRSDPDHLPWTLADTSPSSTEPLAELFLRLLDLPLSRFGLHEILDLLGNSCMAQFTRLDARRLQRLQHWLYGAGARWGLNAAHRHAHAAPEDAASTWQFALERLLLGTATAETDDLVGDSGYRVAPCPELESSAIEDLGRLLAVLDRLDDWRKQLSGPATAQGWRDILLGILDGLFPQEPASSTDRHTLERLRHLLEGFSDSAQLAGFDREIPADILRTWWNQSLTQADTRAPLLTGGISFARMVPMRLLPFRVICVLGLNDGDFPQRDPAAGLNRISADLSTPYRRTGDRSTREDDRFLFLQLLVSAQEVFYLSYLGADPHDGSVREPSVVVSELLDAAAHQHVDPEAVRPRLSVRHPLQIFSPATFGDEIEPRRFSYQAQWRMAFDGNPPARSELPAWLPAPLPAIMDAANATVPDKTNPDKPSLGVHVLRRFLLDPASAFLRERLNLLLPEIETPDPDLDLLQLAPGLLRFEAQSVILDALIQNDSNALFERLRARALLPSSQYGRWQCQELQRTLLPFADKYREWSANSEPNTRIHRAELDQVILEGEIEGIHPHRLIRILPAPLNGRAVIRYGLDWLLANATGMSCALIALVSDAASGRPTAHAFDPVSTETAKAALNQLLQLRSDGLHTPLLFAPRTGWAIHTAENERKARTAAHVAWHGSQYGGIAERNSDAARLVFRGRDILSDPEDYAELVRNSQWIYSLLLHAQMGASQPA